ncbi:MFS general substrate transporter [Diplocarpon rosae]|nr:MFS general substrate transporter [Diplocarpon rosae]
MSPSLAGDGDTEKAETVQAGLPGSESVITFDDAPSLDPQNWSRTRKCAVLFVAFNLVISSTNGASLATGGITSTLHEFGEENCYGARVLPVAVYLVGYALGNTVLAPLSEHYGRRPVNLVTTFFFVVWMTGCTCAPNWLAFNIFRFLNGFFAAGPPSTVSGMCADLYSGEFPRGDALLGYNIATQIGSVMGPVISGFAVDISWRLSFGFGIAYGTICFVGALLGAPETNSKVILDKRAKAIRDFKGSWMPRGPGDGEEINLKNFASKVLIRPLSMFCREPLVFFSCVYIAFQYGLFYVFLQSYTIIFVDIYHFNKGEEGLTFLAFGVGTLLTFPAQASFQKFYKRALAKNAPWAHHHGAKRLPLACIAGPFIILSLFWGALTSKASISWVSPALSGIPYGFGYILTIISLLNYLIDNYASLASSANAASNLTRQLVGAALPFAAVPLYRQLGVPWATSLLGFVAAAMSVIPFVFWVYGERILKKSTLVQELARDGNDQ